MWLLMRLGVAAAAFGLRFIGRLRAPRQRGLVDGVPYFVDVQTHKGRVTRIDVGMPLPGSVVFELAREGFIDRLFKALGFSEEIQSQDARFDERVYVVCDHPAFADLLRRDAQARELILAALTGPFSRIWTDGRNLWMRSTKLSAFHEDQAELLARLRRRLAALGSGLGGAFDDPSARRALAMEAVAWSIGGYAAAAFISYTGHRPDIHVLGYKLIGPGLATAIMLFVGLVWLSRFLLGQSSRGHRFVVECALVLFLSLPLAGIQLIADVNRTFDRRATVVIERVIEGAEERRHRGRKGRVYYTYHLRLMPGSDGVPIPSEVQISQELYRASSAGRRLRMEIGRGALGFPWYRSQKVI